MIVEGVLGVVTGLVGNILTSYTNYKMLKLKNEHEKAMVVAETEAMIKETEANIRITEAEVQGEIAKIEETNYGTNIKLGNKQALESSVLTKLFESKWTSWAGTILALLLGMVDVLRTSIRPALTLYLVAMTSWLTLEATTLIQAKGNILTGAQAQDLFSDVTTVVLHLTVSTVTWWFADRRIGKGYNKVV